MPEFPVHVKFEDWDLADESYDSRTGESPTFANEDVNEYMSSLFDSTLVLGLYFGVIGTIVLLFLACIFHCPGPVGSPKQRSGHCPGAEKSRKIALATLIACICLTLCGVALFSFGLNGWYGDTQDAVVHSKDAAVEAGEFFCTGDVENYNRDQNGAQCNVFSLDGFLRNINVRATKAFDSVNAVVVGISAVLPPVDSLIQRLQEASTSLTDMETSLDGYQVSSTEVRDLLDALNAKDPNAPPIISTNIPDSSTVPEISDADIMFLTDALEEVDSSIVTVEDLRIQVADEIDNLNNDVVPEVDDIRTDIIDLTTDIQETIYDTMEELELAYGDLDDADTLLSDNMNNLWGFYAFVAAMSLFPPSIALISVIFSPKRGMACCSCCCTLCSGVLLYIPLIIGILAFSQVYVEDMCDVLLVGTSKSDFKGVFEVNLADTESDFGDTTVVLGNVINPMLQCRAGCEVLVGGYEPDALDLAEWANSPFNPVNHPENFTNVGLSSPSCFEEEPAGAIDANGHFRLTQGMYDTTNNFAGILGIESEFNFTRRVDEFLEDIVNAQAELNQTELIKDSRDFITSDDVTAALEEDYTNNGDSYVQIDSAIIDINAIFATLPMDTYDPSEDQKWQDVWGMAPPNAQLIANNADLRDQLSAATNSLSTMRTTIESVTSAQGALDISLQQIDNDLVDLEEALDDAIEALGITSSLTNAVVLYTYVAAPGHLECSWLASTYSNVVEEDICVDYTGSITPFVVGLGLISASAGLLVFIMLDCGNPKRTTLLDDQDDTHEIELGSPDRSARYPGLAFQSNPPVANAVPSAYSKSDMSDIPDAYPVGNYRSGSVTDTV